MASFSAEALVRGYHVYKDIIWAAVLGEELPCKRESGTCTTCPTASLASLMAAGLRDAETGPLVSGRASTVWKYRYNAIFRSRSRSQLAGLYLTRVRIVPRLVCSVPVQN